MNREPKLVLVAGCASAVLLADVGQALAETPAPDASSVEEVVVTAQKRTELLKNVPASVTAVTSSSLQDAGAAKLDDYVAKIPGLTVSNVSMANASTQLTIRGVTTGVGGNPTVGVYIDDSPFGASTLFGGFIVPDLDPQDLARVEVLRGPQGTLYGAGSLGGLLKYVTAAPDPSHVFGRMEVDGSTVEGGDQGYGLRASANLPINDTLALRVSGYDRRDPGYVDNVLTGQDNINDTDAYGGRASLGWQINPDWKVRLSALYQHQEGAGPIVDYDPVTFRPAFGDLNQSHPAGTGVDRQAIAAYNLEVEGRLGDFATITSATAYDRQRLHLNVDYSPVVTPAIAAIFGVPNVAAAIDQPVGVDKFVQEVRIASPAEDRLSWQVGGFYTHEHTTTTAAFVTTDPLSGAPVGGFPLLYNSHITSNFEEAAAFGDATYRFSRTFDITGGVRYSHNTQHNRTVNDGLFNGGFSDIVGTSSDSSVTWLVNPRFHLNDDTMIYGRLATGYRPGGPNAGFPGTPTSYGPDKVTNYELGLKSDLFDRRLSVELSAYWIDWKDIQVQELSPFGSYIGNGPSAISKGFEAASTWRPVRGLQIYGDLAYQDAYVTQDFPSGGVVALNGDRLPFTPLWSGAIGGDYRFPLFARWDGQVGADWRHVGRTAGSFNNPGIPRFEHPAYDVVDLRAGISDGRWSLMLFARNIGDERGQTADLNLGLAKVAVIQPRTFAISLSTSF
jgi:outer membrane receptor protein involved in Fe transport